MNETEWNARQYLLVLKEKNWIPLKLTIFHTEGKYLKFLRLFGGKKLLKTLAFLQLFV